MKVNERGYYGSIYSHVDIPVDNLKTSWGDAFVIHTMGHMRKVLIRKFHSLWISS